jgi:hypothetical protein
MKKLVFGLVVLVFVCGMVAFAADFAQPTPNSTVIYDFESLPADTVIDTKTPGQEYNVVPDQVQLFYYDDAAAGKNSHISATVVNDAAQGNQALKIDWKLDGWCGIGLQSPAGMTGPMWDWENAKSITFYAKSADGNKASFVIGVADAGDERFRVAMKTEVQGDQWIKFVLPMERFKARGDWQPDKAKRNTFIDSPGTQFELCPLSAKGSIIIDYIEVNN